MDTKESERYVIARYNKKGIKVQPRILRIDEDAEEILAKMGYKKKGEVWKNDAGFTAEIISVDINKKLAPARL